jgi:hypothetical protein
MRKAAEERWETEIPRVEMDIADEIRKEEEAGLFSKLSLRVSHPTVLLFSLFSQKLLLVGFSLILKILDKHLQKLRHRNVVLPGYFSQYIHIRFMSPDRQLFFGWISLIRHFLGLSMCSKNTRTSPDN